MWRPERILRVLVLLWGRSQEPDWGHWLWHWLSLPTQLLHWLLSNLELLGLLGAGITDVWEALVSASSVWGHHIELVDTGLLAHFLSAWRSIYFWILTQKWSRYMAVGQCPGAETVRAPTFYVWIISHCMCELHFMQAFICWWPLHCSHSFWFLWTVVDV